MTSIYPNFNGTSRKPATGRAEAEADGVRRELEDAAKPYVAMLMLPRRW